MVLDMRLPLEGVSAVFILCIPCFFPERPFFFFTPLLPFTRLTFFEAIIIFPTGFVSMNDVSFITTGGDFFLRGRSSLNKFNIGKGVWAWAPKRRKKEIYTGNGSRGVVARRSLGNDFFLITGMGRLYFDGGIWANKGGQHTFEGGPCSTISS